MNNLYNSLAEIYDAMYRTFIDYNDEYNFYSQILKDNHCNQVLEIGCGTGHLATKFIENRFHYTGLDLSEQMLAIAHSNYPDGEFLKGDVRTFDLNRKFESVIIAGRTISYLVSNNDIYDSLIRINKHLVDGGIICFDCIDANKFIPSIRKGEVVVHKAKFDGRSFIRESLWNVNLSQSWTFDWQSVYFEDQNGRLNRVGEDNSTVRAFTKDEIKLFLELTGFEVMEIRDRPSYAFDTFVVIAKSTNGK